MGVGFSGMAGGDVSTVVIGDLSGERLILTVKGGGGTGPEVTGDEGIGGSVTGKERGRC